MREWFHVPADIDPNLKLPKSISHVIDENGCVIATTYDNDRKYTRMITKAYEMYDMLNIILNSESNLDPGIYKELDRIKDFIDGYDDSK